MKLEFMYILQQLTLFQEIELGVGFQHIEYTWFSSKFHSYKNYLIWLNHANISGKSKAWAI